MIAVPLRPVPNQTGQIVLAGQSCVLHVYQLAYGLFADVTANNRLVAAGALCRNQCRLVRGRYLGFIGNLTFWDSQGEDDPVYTGLGSRFFLLYLTANELPGG